MNPRYALVAARAGHRCEYCRAPEVIFNFPFEVEHVIPPGMDGSDSPDNWALACRSCNLFKGDGIDGTDHQTESKASLFHPRSDVWENHFVVDMEQGTIEGRTAERRVTVQRLRMNSPTQVLARKQWTRIGLFP